MPVTLRTKRVNLQLFKLHVNSAKMPVLVLETGAHDTTVWPPELHSCELPDLPVPHQLFLCFLSFTTPPLHLRPLIALLLTLTKLS